MVTVVTNHDWIRCTFLFSIVSDIKRPSLSVSIKRQPSLSVGDINVLDTLKESIIHSLDGASLSWYCTNCIILITAGMTRVISDECSIPLNSDTISLIIDTVLGESS